jgi:hypothetical protein
MPAFKKGGDLRTPFGRNQYLRSTRNLQFNSFTIAAATVPAVTIDGFSNQKILQAGTVLAKITTGPNAGKVGPYSTDTTGVTDGRSSAANIVGINDTFLPWQLMERDVEVAVLYHGVVVQGWCLEYTAAGGTAPQALSNTTADAMRGTKTLDILFN